MIVKAYQSHSRWRGKLYLFRVAHDHIWMNFAASHETPIKIWDRCST